MAGRFYPVTSIEEADALRRRLLDLAASEGCPAMVGVSHAGVARGQSFATAVVRLCAVLPGGAEDADESILDGLGVLPIDESVAEIDHVSVGAAGLHRLFGSDPPGAAWSAAEDWLLRRWNRGALADRAGWPADAIERAEKLAGTPIGVVAEALGGILSEPGPPTIDLLRRIATAPDMPDASSAAALILDLLPQPSERIRAVDAGAFARKHPAAFRGACAATLERIARAQRPDRAAKRRLAQAASIIRRALDGDDAALPFVEMAVWKLRGFPVIASAARAVCDGAAASALEDRTTASIARGMIRDPGLAAAGFVRERAAEGGAVLLALRHRAGGTLTVRTGEGVLRYGFDGVHGEGLTGSLVLAVAGASGEDPDGMGCA